MPTEIHYNLEKHPTFHLYERLVNLARRRECFVGLSLTGLGCDLSGADLDLYITSFYIRGAISRNFDFLSQLSRTNKKNLIQYEKYFTNCQVI